MKKKNNHYTFMFFPEGKGSTFTLRIHRYTLYLTVVSILLIITGLSALIYKTGDIALKLQLVHGLKEENARLREYNKDLQISADKIASIDSMAAYLHRLAGVSDVQGAASAAPPIAAGGVQPLTKVEARDRDDDRGAQKGAPSSSEIFLASVPNIMPVDGWITKQYVRSAEEDDHLGLDIAAAAGTPIRVTAMGVVDDVRNDKYYGLTVDVRHENGFVTRYGHCLQILVSAGDRVNRGQTIALIGNTGRSTAPHLHYEVMKDGKYVDPMNYIGTQKQ